MSDRGYTRRSLLAQLACARAAFSQTSDSLPRGLKPEHPRLILLDRDIDRIRGVVRESAPARRILNDLEREADRIQNAPVVEYKTAGPGLLQQSRHALDRITTLALLYRLNGRRQHLDRAVREMHSAASFRNWNPSHFLDTAEMTRALAIGYDWLHAALTPVERAWIRASIVEKGLNQALPIYERQESWAANRNNWNIVCNAGMALGALAIADEATDKAATILRYVLDSIPRGLSAYGPDGGWPEGPDYWHYATRSAVALMAALETSFGHDFGLSNTRGFDRTGKFRMYCTGPSGKTFNFADAHEQAEPAPEMFWLARRFNQPALAWQEQRLIEKENRPDPLDLAWYQREARAPALPAWPLDAVFAGVQCAFFRSSWEDPNALFLAVKGGDNKSWHSHLDLGGFVIDAGGFRWALDAGPDDYSTPGSSGRHRGSSYRARTEAHNTMLIDGENQDPKGDARITRHEFTPDLSWVQIDLTRAYPARLKLLQRRIGMAQRQAVLIQDQLKSDTPVEASWGMLTDADVSFDGQSAVLTKEGWSLSAEIRTPRHAVFDVQSSPASRDRKLVVRLGEKVSDLDLNVALAPYRTGQPKPKITARFPV